MSTERILVFCSNPQNQISHLRGGMAKAKWNRAVRAIPKASAHDLVRLGGQHFYALSFAQAAERFGISPADLRELSSKLTTAEYQPLLGMRTTDEEFKSVPRLLARVEAEAALKHDDLGDLLPNLTRESAVTVIVLDEKTARALRAKPETTTAPEA